MRGNTRSGGPGPAGARCIPFVGDFVREAAEQPTSRKETDDVLQERTERTTRNDREERGDREHATGNGLRLPVWRVSPQGQVDLSGRPRRCSGSGGFAGPSSARAGPLRSSVSDPARPKHSWSPSPSHAPNLPGRGGCRAKTTAKYLASKPFSAALLHPELAARSSAASSSPASGSPAYASRKLWIPSASKASKVSIRPQAVSAIRASIQG
jgi:hypothetical protein